MAIEIGLQGHSETLVEQEDTAKSVGSGDLLVYATPCMAALMEGAACESIAPYLAEGETSVGVSLQLFHTAATPVGMEVRAESVVTAVDGKKDHLHRHSLRRGGRDRPCTARARDRQGRAFSGKDL